MKLRRNVKTAGSTNVPKGTGTVNALIPALVEMQCTKCTRVGQTRLDQTVPVVSFNHRFNMDLIGPFTIYVSLFSSSTFIYLQLRPPFSSLHIILLMSQS